MPINIQKTLKKLQDKLRRESQPPNFSFDEFLQRTAERPEHTLRNVFQVFHDMIHYYVPEGFNEYPNDPESINYICYDCTRLFVEDSENPFFADRLLANRLVNLGDSLKTGALRNRMLVFVGPPGSGKSTFLNNFLYKMEKYVQTAEGEMFETVWQIDVEKFGLSGLSLIPDAGSTVHLDTDDISEHTRGGGHLSSDRFLVVPCPSHDHPIIQIPRELRHDFLNDLIADKDLKKAIFHQKEFEWIFKDSPCPVCTSLHRALENRVSPEDLLTMLRVRNYEFSRKLGEGISVYNPGDKVMKVQVVNPELQRWLDAIFRNSSEVQYLYSRMAKTNNGIFAIMDGKSNNVDRLHNVHGIISDGIHKVGLFEEHISSLFMTLINPEDMAVINKEKSFQDRIITIPIPYVRDFSTEVAIYRNTYSGAIDHYFLPEVLTAFAKVIVASRLNPESPAMAEWIEDPGQYAKFCDENLLLLKMEIFSGAIPFWLSEKDVKRLDRLRRRSIIMEGNNEGLSGYSGRDSLEMFNLFFSQHKNFQTLIGIQDVVNFFRDDSRSHEMIPPHFLESLVDNYDYATLQSIKESMFFYNEDQIANELCNYLFAINNDLGQEVECPFTGDKLNLTEAYFSGVEERLLGVLSTPFEREKFRNDVLRHYVAKTLHEIGRGKTLAQTKQFQELNRMYSQNLKENVLDPFINNDNFRRAIKDYGADSFKNYDRRIREEVQFLLKNLKFKFNYTDQGAKQICMYVIDKKLADHFEGR